MIQYSMEKKINKDISVIFSFKNEELNIQELIDRTVKVFKDNKLSYELLFVDDRSTDSSRKIIKENINKNKNIKYMLMSRNFGVGPCIIAGLENTKAKCSVYMDSDLQDTPELIINLYDEFLKGYDVVHTSRLSRKGEPFYKLFITRAAYIILNKITTPKVIIESGDFRLLSNKARENVLELRERNPFIRNLSQWIGFKQKTIYYHRKTRSQGNTKFNPFSALNPWKEFIRGVTSFSSIPLYLSLILSSFFFFLCILLIPLLIIGWIKINTFLIFIFIFSVYFILGIYGVYLDRILEQTNSRPLYIIDEKINF